MCYRFQQSNWNFHRCSGQHWHTLTNTQIILISRTLEDATIVCVQILAGNVYSDYSLHSSLADFSYLNLCRPMGRKDWIFTFVFNKKNWMTTLTGIRQHNIQSTLIWPDVPLRIRNQIKFSVLKNPWSVDKIFSVSCSLHDHRGTVPWDVSFIPTTNLELFKNFEMFYFDSKLVEMWQFYMLISFLSSSLDTQNEFVF